MEGARLAVERQRMAEWLEEHPAELDRVRGLRRTARELWCWLRFLARKYNGRMIWPKQRTLAELIGVGVEAIRRATRRLEAMRLLGSRFRDPPSTWTRNRHWRRVYWFLNGGVDRLREAGQTVGLMVARIGTGKKGSESKKVRSPSRGTKAPQLVGSARPVKRGEMHRMVELWAEWHQRYMGHPTHAGPRDYRALKEALEFHSPEFILEVMRGILAHRALHALWKGMEGAIPLHRFVYHFGAYATHWELLRVQEAKAWDAGDMLNELGEMVPRGLHCMCLERNLVQADGDKLERWLGEIRRRVPIRYWQAMEGRTDALPGFQRLLQRWSEIAGLEWTEK